MARIAFLLRQLEGGGAERQLLNLASGLANRGHDVHLIVWIGGGRFERLLPLDKITYHIVDRGRPYDAAAFLLRMSRLLRRLRPSVLHGYMDTGNFVAALMRPAIPGAKIVWGVRHAGIDLSDSDTVGHFLYQLCRPLSHLPDLIIANSSAGRTHALASGYPANRVRVVFNGTDTNLFVRHYEAGLAFRRSLAYSEAHLLVGMSARLDPVKDHLTFVDAAKIAVSRNPLLRFICVGEGAEPYRGTIIKTISQPAVRDFIRWVGFVSDMPTFYSALDIATSTSRVEGFSNAIAEAMACGAPCVATTVGDSAEILGNTGLLVPPGNPHALAEAWLNLLDTVTEDSREQCRARIVERFCMERLIDQSEFLLFGDTTALRNA